LHTLPAAQRAPHSDHSTRLLHLLLLPLLPLLQDVVGDGGRTASLRDVDGSLSGYKGATLLPSSAAGSLGFYSAPGCVSHPAYGLACPQRYVNLEIGVWDWSGGGPSPQAVFTRANLSPGLAGASGLAKQRLPSLQGQELAPKQGSTAGRYYNVKAGTNGVYLMSLGSAAGKCGPASVDCAVQLAARPLMPACRPPTAS
jgi:hypothetical protein